MSSDDLPSKTSKESGIANPGELSSPIPTENPTDVEDTNEPHFSGSIPPSTSGPSCSIEEIVKVNQRSGITFRSNHCLIQRSRAFHSRTELRKIYGTPLPVPPPPPPEKVPSVSGTAIKQTASTQGWQAFDLNRNIVWARPTMRKRKSRFSLSESTIGKYLGIPPDLFESRRPVFVYDLMGHLRSYFYGNERNAKLEREIRIKFPDEIVKQADLHGDRAGKSREVTRSTYLPRRRQKIRKVYDAKRRRTIIDPEILDDIDLNQEPGCCDSFMHALTFGCEGQEEKVVETPGGPVKITQKYRKASIKFGNHLEIAAEFIDGNMKSIRGAENLLSFPFDSEVTETLNYVAAQLWICTFGIHYLFQNAEGNDGIPTKTEFEGVLSNLELIAHHAEKTAEKALTFSPFFYEFGKELLIQLAKTGKPLGIKLETTISKPVRKRQGLHLLKTNRDLKEKDAVVLKLVARSKIGVKPRWENFNQFPKSFKLTVIEDLVDSSLEAIQKLRTRVKFVADDVVNGKFDDDDPPFMAICLLLHDLLRYFQGSPETTKSHMQNLTEVITQFLNDTRDFIIRTQTVLSAAVEIHNMVQLCFDYMKGEYAFDISAYSEATKSFASKGAEKSFIATKCNNCCKRRKKEFHYKVEDFFHTDYRDALRLQWIGAGNAQLLLRPADEEDLEEEKEKIEVHFAEPEGDEEDAVFELKEFTSSSGTIYVERSDTRSAMDVRTADGIAPPSDAARIAEMVNPIISSDPLETAVSLHGISSSIILPKSNAMSSARTITPILKAKASAGESLDKALPPIPPDQRPKRSEPTPSPKPTEASKDKKAPDKNDVKKDTTDKKE